MAEGKIKWFNTNLGYGFIEREGPDDLFIHINQWRGDPGSVPNEGDKVTFDEGIGPKGKPEAQDVYPAHDDNRFLNPYNFVRYLDKPRPQGHVLGDCPPPPHDRYVGLTGRITCQLEAETPLFISDSHAVQGKVGEHRTFRFFQIVNEAGELEPALPATSLRGMLRSVFEAATNSCFAVFDGGQRLEFRERPEYGNKVKSGAGIVNALPELPKNGQPGKDGEIVLCRVAKVGAYYEEDDAWKNVLGRKPDGQAWQCGDYAFARVKRLRRGYVVRELSISKKRLQPLGDGEEYVEGWLKVTGKSEGTNKRSEFLFLNPDKHGCPGVVQFGLDQMEEYNFVLAGQLDRDDLPASPQSSQLALGDLVWVETGRKEGRLQARRIVRIQVPRTPYQHTVGKLLPSYFHRCDDYDALCPACRVFGWVHENAAGLGKKERVTYAGRVRLSRGKLIGEADTVDDPAEGITLTILSTPKPTTTQFYLLDQKGRPHGNVDYDTPDARLRGRKVYRHHRQEPSRHEKGYEYEQVVDEQDEEDDGKSDQNRTVRGVLKEGATFEFTVDFENLAPEELGALLWSLELEKGMHHRLGYAKPLGFGSVSVKVKTLQVLKPQQQFSSLKAGKWPSVAETQWRRWVEGFKTQMAAAYGDGASFTELPNILDLRVLTSEPDVAHIHYPRLESPPKPEGENFRWFVANKRQDRPLALGLADADSGLPLDLET